MDRQALIAAVDEHFVVTGDGLTPWPDPHDVRDDPADEEYSRVSDPEKYRILAARAEAWACALVDLGLADLDRPDAVDWRDAAPTHTQKLMRLSPRRVGATPLVFAIVDVFVPGDSVEVAVGDPAVVVHAEPSCGCDACDDGSEYLLEEFDSFVWNVVSGQLVHVAGDGWTASAVENGWSLSGTAPQPVPIIFVDARAGRSAHRVVTGPPWEL